ncbi:MAG TPA: LicD family protein [Gammaproteobacteria bacterium]
MIRARMEALYNALLGRAPVVNVPESLDDIPAGMVEGHWDAKVREKDRTLVIAGRVGGRAAEHCSHAFLFFNGKLLGIGSARSGSFRFLIQKASKGFAPGATFQVVTHEGIVPHASGPASWVADGDLVSPSGFLDLETLIAAGNRLTKKGTLGPVEISEKKKERYFNLVRKIETWFETLDYPVMVSHGTLLGLYRDGDLIPHDDDFDCLYLSRETTARAVALERREIVRGLLKAGFKCRVGKTGHIKISNKYVEVDLMPAWIENDTLFVSSYSQISGASRFVLPPRRIKWKPFGMLTAFNRPKKFLEGQYGPNWRKPDPGYRLILTEKGKRNRKALVPPQEEMDLVRELRQQAEAEAATPARQKVS